MIKPPDHTKHLRTAPRSALHFARLRVESGLTQPQFAKLMGRTEMSIRRYEHGLSVPDYPTQYLAESIVGAMSK